MTGRHARLLVSHILALAVSALFVVLAASCSDVFGGDDDDDGGAGTELTAEANANALIQEGRDTFRNDTFGDEAFWGDTLRLHEAIAGVANGGVGAGLSPAQALGLGLKVDSEALGAALRDQIATGLVDLDDPANTLELLRRNAVIGVKGFFDAGGALTSVGIQCALCHSTVDDSFQPGMGSRRDGWANRDLNVGAIVALAPDLSVVSTMLGVDEAAVRDVLRSWGPGKYDAQLLLDGKAAQPGGRSSATLIPPAFGLAGVNLHTWTGWGSVTYWNAFVANTQMHGQGTFYDPRLEDAAKFPIAAAANFGSIEPKEVDRITPKLAALHVYQLAIPIPRPPAGSFDAVKAADGEVLFHGSARCSECHVPPLFTEPGWNMHTADEIGIDDFQSSRSPDERYRTAPLRGLWTHQTGGFYHDGRFATLLDVVAHYNTHFALGLTTRQQQHIVEYLKSL